MSDDQLGAFLRSRREAVNPADVGLRPGGRRRTPGLRRSELALLAGISVEYLTRLEQGRDRRPSMQVLSAIAEALQLAPEERVHLRILSKDHGGGLCLAAYDPPARDVRPTVRALLDRMEPGPAYVLNRLGDVLAYNSGWERLVAPLGLLPGDPPNLLTYVFTDPRARTAYPDWARVADERVADFRAGHWRSDPYAAALVEELTLLAGPAFGDRMAAAPAVPRRTGVERLVHPEVGELRLQYEVLDLPDTDTQRLVVQLPADDATVAALDRLAGRRPGALRAVSG